MARTERINVLSEEAPWSVVWNYAAFVAVLCAITGVSLFALMWLRQFF